MSNPFFRFKQFTVHHDKCAMKVGVDGVTLGAWADTSGAKQALDAGCGSGLIALMIAQRSSAMITAIDIDGQSAAQARENADKSPWQNRITVLHDSLQDFTQKTGSTFDLIVCNPPYFARSLQSPSAARTIARHNDTLPFRDLIENAKKLLTEKGKLCLILPVNEGITFVEDAERAHLFCSRQTTVFPNRQKEAKRLLLEFCLTKRVCRKSELTIEEERGRYTAEYTALVNDFYLRL